MRSLPFDEKIELVVNTIRKLEFEILDNRNILLPSSESMFNKVYLLYPVYTDKPDNKHITLEIMIHTWSAKVDLPILRVQAEVIMKSLDEKINEEKDLLNLAIFLLSELQEYIYDNNIVDKNDKTINVPTALPAGYRFQGLIQ